MKQFAKYTLATITGIAIVSVVAGILFIGIIVGAAVSTSGDESVELKENSVLVVKLSGEIIEHKTENPFDELMGNSTVNTQGLDDIVGAIRKAAEADEIKGIYLEAGIMDTDYASLQEIRNALAKFKASKKWVVAFGNEYTQGAYYVCSVADKIWINPQGMIDLHGLASQPMFYKELLEKFGVRMKVVKVGTYKSATEQYTEERMSEANREQVTRFITSIWNTVLSDIGKSRNIPAERLNELADEYTLLQSSDYLAKNKLVDKRLYATQVKDEVKALLGIKSDEEINKISCPAMNKTADTDLSESDKIAIYYCEGGIVQAEELDLLSGGSGIVSKKVCKDLEKLAKDDDIKAVVVRINSGGGDAFASEEIWNSMLELRKKKPVVVSMGGMAASGAYYMSAPASWIVAQTTTLTGSIGIFGVFPDVSGLMTEKLGIKFDNVKTNKHSDFNMMQTARPFNAEEEAMLQQYINRGYELFCKRVADGRKMKVEEVKKIAEGRVWIGPDAKEIGLVDELGGLETALKKAAQLAKTKGYERVSYPEEEDWMTQLLEAKKGHGTLDEQLRTVLGAYYEPFIMVRNIQNQSPIQARCEILNVKN